MQPQLKITLITCVMNRAATIGEAIDSVQAQSYANIEHIIIDGGSSDGTLQLVQDRQHPDMRIFSGRDDGIYDALNKGVRHATGDVVGLVHSDDRLAHLHVIANVAAAFSDGAAAVHGDLNYVSAAEPGRIVRHWRSGPFAPGSLARGWMPPHPALFVRRDALIGIGDYDTRYAIAADYDLMLRLFSQPGFHSAYLPEVLVEMRLGGASNASLARILRKSREDYLILRRNHIGGLPSLVAKNVRKIPQFWSAIRQR